ncbi:MAG TPA: hypothetical protein VKA84_00940 [Gemmatimonadaceae bacterium]|nr:hypothetical protein [Gemmatimonadaceae bacterium]
MRSRPTLAPAALAIALLTLGSPAAAGAQDWRGPYEQFYLPAQHNWAFRNGYAAADRLFNAFDYGHAILYELLYTRPDAPASRLEGREFDFITKRLLVRPPRLPLEERAIEVEYAKLVPEAVEMFEWAHVLHRQLYDVLADERLTPARRDAEVARLLAYYRSRPDLAFSAVPKSMALMQEQPYSLAFRTKYPKFNGLIWAYHWLQVGLYEPLVVAEDRDAKQTGVLAAVARFRQMIEDAPARMPRVMPMTAAVAPEFARRYPEAAIVFDNLHSMHDVVSDILANPSVPRGRKRAEILLAAARYRDDTSFAMTVSEWREMSAMMGIENQGGPATGFLTPLPAGTVARGAVMRHADGRMDDSETPASAPDSAPMAQHQHAMPPAAPAPAPDSAPAAATMDSATARIFEAQLRMLRDPVIRRRVASDTALRRTIEEALSHLPAAEQEELRALLRDAAAAEAPTPKSTAPRRQSKPAPKPAAKPRPADPHAGHKP